MDASDLLNTTAGYLDEISKEGDIGVTAGLQEAIKEAAVEAKEELDCNDATLAGSTDHLLTAD